MRTIKEFLKPTQSQLFHKLALMFGRKAICQQNKYILVKGEAPVMLVAHMDTVHKKPVKYICETDDGNVLMSPQGIGGDDRCGVYALVKSYELADKKPWLLFTCDEEIGGVGAEYFCDDAAKGFLPKELFDLKCLIEIDRKGHTDAVYYDCANEDFEKYITSKGYKTEWGSFSDITVVGPALGVASVNLSSGYYNAHTQHEYINIRHLEDTISKVSKIVAESVAETFPQYEHVDLYDDYYGDKYSYDNGLISDKYVEMYNELIDYFEANELEKVILEDGWQGIEDLYNDVMAKATANVINMKGFVPVGAN